MQTIDISGSDGNAHSLMGTARRWAKQMGKNPEEIEALISKMKDGDYDNLVSVFEEEFKHVCKVIGK